LDFTGAGKRELTAWFQWLKEKGITSVRVSDLQAEPGQATDQTLRMWVEVMQDEGARKFVTIRVQNRANAAVTGLNLTAYLPTDYPQVDRAHVVPPFTRQETERPRLFWCHESVAAGATVSYTIPLTRIARPVNHPISGAMDVYLDGGGVAPRWSFITLAGTPENGWYLPFESYNPDGRATSAASRTTFAPPEANRATADRIREQVRTRPTNKANMGERLDLLFAWAQSFIRAGRQADLDTVLPPQRYDSLRRQVQSGQIEQAPKEVDRALLGLAELLSR
jgi:hypothetical protein